MPNPSLEIHTLKEANSMKLYGNTAQRIIFDQKHSQITIRREGGTMGNNSNIVS